MFRYAGFIVGLLWVGINVGLDLAVLIPLAKMCLPDYFGEIALRYVVILIMAIAFDVAARPSGVAS
jgi:hypothetical protein